MAGEGILVIFVLLFVATAAGMYFLLSDSGETSTENVEAGAVDEGTGGEVVQEGNTTENDTEIVIDTSFGVNITNVSEPHWDHTNLTYFVRGNRTLCEGAPLLKMREAMDIIETASKDAITFSEIFADNGTDIYIDCLDTTILDDEIYEAQTCEEVILDYRTIQFNGQEVLEDNQYHVSTRLKARNESDNMYELCWIDMNSHTLNISWEYLREAKPTISGNVITGGRKTMYTLSSKFPYCANFPAKEVHDLMHLFGFAHSEIPAFDEHFGWYSKDIRYFKDIMFPYTYCPYKTEIGANYNDCLTYIYSDGKTGNGCAAVEFIS